MNGYDYALIRTNTVNRHGKSVFIFFSRKINRLPVGSNRYFICRSNITEAENIFSAARDQCQVSLGRTDGEF